MFLVDSFIYSENLTYMKLKTSFGLTCLKNDEIIRMRIFCSVVTYVCNIFKHMLLEIGLDVIHAGPLAYELKNGRYIELPKLSGIK